MTATAPSPTSERFSTPFSTPFKALSAEELVWIQSRGIGYCRAYRPEMYDLSYWMEYRRRDESDMGAKLSHARVRFVEANWGAGGDPVLVDIGIGGGRFLSACHRFCATTPHGFDVNPHAIAHLVQTGKYLDPTRYRVDIACFWDSLEHIPDPGPILANVRNCVMLSTPIYTDAQDCLQSKHFKPGEHVWYFTRAGLIDFMGFYGFHLVDEDPFEMELGREAIGSFCFSR